MRPFFLLNGIHKLLRDINQIPKYVLVTFIYLHMLLYACYYMKCTNLDILLLFYSHLWNNFIHTLYTLLQQILSTYCVRGWRVESKQNKVPRVMGSATLDRMIRENLSDKTFVKRPQWSTRKIVYLWPNNLIVARTSFEPPNMVFHRTSLLNNLRHNTLYPCMKLSWEISSQIRTTYIRKCYFHSSCKITHDLYNLSTCLQWQANICNCEIMSPAITAKFVLSF